MPPRTIGYDETLETTWEELCFSEAAILAEPLTKDLAVLFTKMIEQVVTLRQGQWECWRQEKRASSLVAKVNYYIDITVDDVSRNKLNDLRTKNRALKDREARSTPEYAGYFPIPAYSIIRLGLESELPYVRPWLRMLAGETSEEFKELLVRLTQEISDGDSALKQRADADESTALHRLRQINPFIDGINKLRTDMYGQFLRLSQANNLSRDWADLFFMSSQPPAPNKAEARGMSRALFKILEARKLEVSDEQRTKIGKSTDLAVFDAWLLRALAATTTAEVLGG
jgi:hypothetical protein